MTITICLAFPNPDDGAIEARVRSFVEALETGGTFVDPGSQDVEPILLADIVVADVSSRDPDLLYALGVRHGRGHGCTVALCEADAVEALPFALGIGALVPYVRSPVGGLRSDSAVALRVQLGRSIRAWTERGVETVDPTLRALLFDPGRPAARKLDEFIHELHRRALGPVGRDVSAALAAPDETAREQLRFLLSRRDEAGFRRADLVAIFVGFREAKGYQDMVDLAETLPLTLRDTTLVREQTALALNRIAEATDDAARRDALVQQALAELDALAPHQRTSETAGIRGRILKGIWSRSKAPEDLARAIEAYAEGLVRDPRDIYPGVNALTLSFGSPDHRDVVDRLLPVVRFSHAAATPDSGAERYWHIATGIELAVMAGDDDAARDALERLLSDEDAELSAARQDWMLETTATTLARLRDGWPGGGAPSILDELLGRIGERDD